MNELSLFTGGGGGVLASVLLGWRTIGYVEWQRFCCDRLIDRMRDGHLPTAPVWCGDIREFVRCGAAAEYQGLVDVISAGFPCQPFSLAGKRSGVDDPRNQWPATRDCIREVQPPWLLLENVPALRCPQKENKAIVDEAYFSTVLGDLAELGFDAEWDLLSAAGVGAWHRRARLWIVAYSNSQGPSEWRAQDTNRKGTDSRPELSRSHWWDTEPALVRVVHGMANRVAQVKALGNGQVPAVAVRAWHELSRRFTD